MSSTNSGSQETEAGRAGTRRRPVILMTADMSDVGGESTYLLRTNYAAAIVEAGGLALTVPFEPEQLSEALDLADGLLITGSLPGVVVTSARIDFERDLIRRAMTAGKPLMGICHGMQLIGEYLGGIVARDRPDLLGEITAHIPGPLPDQLAHEIEIDTDSLLYAWHGARDADVNSLHRHALVGQGRFRIAAVSPDGIIEAIEGTGSHFCLGVQWHPEYRLTALDRRILRGFVARCRAPGRKPDDRHSDGSRSAPLHGQA